MRELLDAALTMTRSAGDILRQAYQQGVDVRHKGDVDLVTSADYASEAHLIAAIRKRFPDHAILAEESGRGGGAGRAPYRWVLDPLDGTVNFAHGNPHFCVLVALQALQPDGHYQTQIGVTIDPLRNEEFVAQRGHGVRLNGVSMRVSKTAALINTLSATGFSYGRLFQTDDNHAEYCRMNLLTQGVRRFGSAGLDLAYVACGRLDFYWEYTLNPWDLAPGLLQVQEAGGTVTAPDGQALPPDSGSILCTNSLLHPAVVQALTSSKSAPVNSRAGLHALLPPALAARLPHSD